MSFEFNFIKICRLYHIAAIGTIIKYSCHRNDRKYVKIIQGPLFLIAAIGTIEKVVEK